MKYLIFTLLVIILIPPFGKIVVTNAAILCALATECYKFEMKEHRFFEKIRNEIKEEKRKMNNAVSY